MKALERAGKRLLFRAVSLGRWSEILPPSAVRLETVRRVLLVRPDNRLGNLVLATPCLTRLRERLPAARVSLLAGRIASELFRHDPRLDERIVFDHRGLVRNPLRLLPLASRLKGYDLAIDLSHMHSLSVTSSLATLATGAPYRVGYRRDGAERILNLPVEPGPEDRAEHEILLDLLRHVLGDLPPTAPALPLSDREREAARARLALLGIAEGTGPVVGMHLGGKPARRWEAGKFDALADRLVEACGAAVLFLWGPREEPLLAKVRPHRGTKFLLPPLGIRELAGLLSRLSVLVTSDTGPMHLAQAVGTPTVAMFFVGNFERYGYRGGASQVLYAEGASPGVDEVLAAVRDSIRERARSEAT
jgi:ADP-heptose:LPS heptosyltransferase